MDQERIKKLAGIMSEDVEAEHKETGITEIERNPGDMIQNHLDDINKYVDMLEEDELDIDHYSNLIRNAVEKIRYITVDEYDIRY